MDPLHYPPKPKPGDRVAIVSPSGGLPELFPLPYELGLRRLREDFGLIPVEFPTTRVLGSSPADRAADLHAAFADPDIKAVICSIGGDSQITVLPHLDADVLRANPKPFFGYSDATNLLTYLHTLGIVAYHGGAIMTQFGRAGAMHPITADSVRAALFTSGPFDLVENKEFGDIDVPWDDAAAFEQHAAEYRMTESAGWSWLRADRVVEGPSWGGNLEILSWLAMADRNVGDPARYAGGVLVLETSEELPSHVEVYRILRNLGERGLLRQFDAALIGRPKAWAFDRQLSAEDSARYRGDQRTAVERAFDEYNPGALLVFDLEIGHTEPQVVLPYGGLIRVDGPARRITVTY
ncbi:S66 peptidase family protein [Actinospica sp.]|jgi:muramoyltetrapeptide carboxypeptidase LdcA involved in peptidoglycan recycling|uniref:S66 family peptidase n=1 Tax=Actinospica sp. TaxID=1872142 RepID=UPI002C282BCC|nr:S66 peptidase family protein [Actinospica sp.]HWG27091.1 S66 peptidase family protein [Actinospica sp.]